MPRRGRILFILLFSFAVILLLIAALLFLSAETGHTEIITTALTILDPVEGRHEPQPELMIIPARCAHPAHDPVTQECNFCGEKVCHEYIGGQCSCGKTAEMVTNGFDPSLWEVCANSGRIETLSYQTKDESSPSGETVTKNMEVYLPHGYSSDEKYNVLILLHGSGGDESYWFKERGYEYSDGYGVWEKFSNVLDNMIDRKLCKPMIVVSPTYYLSEADRLNGNNLSEDVQQMRHEVLESILPCIITNYSTYAESSDYSAMCNARDHFGFIGASFGGMITCNAILTYDIDVFSWIGTISGMYANVPQMNRTWTELGYDALKLHYLYTSAGEYDTMQEDTVDSYASLRGYSTKVTEGNSCYIETAGAGHEERVWDNAVYNCMQIFFAGT